jgi:MFS family permease
VTAPHDGSETVPAADEAAGTAAPGVFGPGRRMLTGGLVLIVTLVAFESLAIGTVMPLVEDDLGDLWLYGWVFSAFFLGNLVGIVVAGTAADRMRPAVPFAAGLVLFAAGLVVGGLAPSMLVLVLGRALQGLGAGAMPAISYVCIGRGYPHEQRPTMFALISSAWVVPSVAGPALAGIVGSALGWRWVLLGLLPLCAVIGVMALVGVATIPAPDEPSTESNLLSALLVAGGAALVLAGLGSGSVLQGLVLVVVGVALGLPAVRRLVPPGTLTARPGLPATVLVRGVLTFAFFCGDAYVPYALVTVRGLSTTVAGLALTAATLTWTAASWIQARRLELVGARRLVALGLAAVALGSLAMLLVLVPSVPAAIGIGCWAVAGFGIGLAYAPLAVVTLAEAAEGQEGRATSSLQLSDMLGTALGAGVGGVLVAVGVAAADSDTAGLVAVYLLGAVVAVGGVLLARRVPGRRSTALP